MLRINSGSLLIGALAIIGVAGCSQAARVASAGPDPVRAYTVAAPSRARDPGSAPVESYVDPAGWLVVYPRSMRVERSSAEAMTSFSEVTFASFHQRTAIHSGSNRRGGGLNVFVHVDPPLDSRGRFPSGAVAFRVLRLNGGPLPGPSADSRFPLTLASFHGGPYYRQPAGVPAPVQRAVEADGSAYEALAWIGRRASARMKSMIGRVISSLVFPRLRPGMSAGSGDFVLRLASRYRVGSFTRISDAGQRYFHFYLVHAPGGFYGIGWGNPMDDPAYASRCAVQLDRARKQFYCSNLKASWDRLGIPITKPAHARSADPLQFTPVELAWDDHLLLDYSESESPQLVRLPTRLGGAGGDRPWPGWKPGRG